MDQDVEAHRLEILSRLEILDTLPEADFDAVTSLAAETFGAETATVSLITADRQWFKSCAGHAVGETGRDVAFCDHTIKGPGVMVVLDAWLDRRFAVNPLVIGEPYIRFYAGAPLTVGNVRVGTLCLLDPTPRRDFDAAQRTQLAAMARIVEQLMRRRLLTDEPPAMRRVLEARSRQLALAESIAGVGHWTVDMASGAITWSEGVYRIHGVEPARFDPMLYSALDFFTAPDRALMDHRLQESWHTGKPFRIEATLRRASDGAPRRILSRGELQRDAAGRPLQIFGVIQDVTEQEALLARIRADQQRFELLARNATDVIATCTLTRIFTYISPAAERVYGYKPDSLIGRSAETLIHPDDRAQVANRLRALAAARDPNATDIIVYRICRGDHAWIWVEAHVRVMTGESGEPEGYHYVARDITQRHEAELTRQFRLLAENATDIITRVALSGRILFVTGACERTLGFPPDAMVGRRAIGFIHPQDRRATLRRYRDFIARGRAAEAAIVQFRAVRRDGSTIWLEGRPRLCMDSDETPLELQDAIRDVTAAKAQEAELIAARQAADEGAQFKTDFLANMSHELRTPLNGILGFADVLVGSASLGPEDRRHARQIKEAGAGLLAIVNDILDLSRIEAGADEMANESVDLHGLLRETLELVRTLADKKSLTLRLELPREAAAVVADPERLRQIMLNLLGNAVKFTDSGSVSLELVCTPHDTSLGVRIAVRDTGIGIPPDRLEAMFGRFEQADVSIAKRFGGTGLGLSLCRGLVSRMGGSIDVESTAGVGTCFTVSLDLPRATLPAKRAAATRAPTTAALEGLRILLAEDVDMNQELYAIFLAPYGVRIDPASNGLEAVRAAEARAYDLILMDMQMPEMDGLEAARRIRAGAGPCRDTPIIALTANVLPAEIEKCRKAGMNGHVGKPVDVGALVEALEAWAPADALAE